MALKPQEIVQQETPTGLRGVLGHKWRLGTAVGASAVAVALIFSACGTDGSDSAEGSGLGEAAEAGHGGEGGNGEAAEGGVVNLLAPNETYDETINGARLILNFDSGANAFIGTVENTTNGPLTRARVEVHLSNGTELGPTTPTDLAPGEVITLNLPSTAAPFDTWSAHPEVGAAEGGEGGAEGAEGSESGSAEGPEGTEGGSAEGPEGGQAAPGSIVHLTSTGISRGVHRTQDLAAGETYAGKLNDLELAITFDAANDQFVGRVKNEATQGVCNTTLGVILDGTRNATQSVLVPSLDLRGRADFTIDAGTAPFDTWAAAAGTFTCTAVVSDGGEGGNESAGGESGSEGGSEGSGEGAGHESGSEGGSESGGEGSGEGGAGTGEEAAPSTPIDQTATGNFNKLDYNIAYDATTKAFRGTVTNNTNQIVCGSRLEIHMSANGNVIELGPTIDTDLAPGETLNVVLSADPVMPDTYSLHPESSACA